MCVELFHQLLFSLRLLSNIYISMFPPTCNSIFVFHAICQIPLIPNTPFLLSSIFHNSHRPILAIHVSSSSNQVIQPRTFLHRTITLPLKDVLLMRSAFSLESCICRAFVVAVVSSLYPLPCLHSHSTLM